MMCRHCGNTRTIDELRAEHPQAISCCPERELIDPLAEIDRLTAELAEARRHAAACDVARVIAHEDAEEAEAAIAKLQEWLSEARGNEDKYKTECARLTAELETCRRCARVLQGDCIHYSAECDHLTAELEEARQKIEHASHVIALYSRRDARLREAGNEAFMAMCAYRDDADAEVFQDAIDALGAALSAPEDKPDYDDPDYDDQGNLNAC